MAHKIDRRCVFEVRVSRREPDDKFKAQVCKVCCFGQDPNDVVDIDRVAVSYRDPDYCPNADDKAYIVNVIAESLQEAKEMGVTIIQQYRTEREGQCDRP